MAACYLKLGECKKSIEACNKLLEANPAHVKALYRRGMAYMSAGDFNEARTDFKAMIIVDKSSEAEAKAALLKLKVKEQEVERKAKKQFKGLFDKKPGEIADVGVQFNEPSKSENEIQEVSDYKISDGEEAEGTPETVSPRRGLLSRFWPVGGRIFSSLGLNRCTIL